MTSYARTTTLSSSTAATKGQLSVLAQAKPAIISSNSSSNNYNIPTGVLSEKLNTTLRFSANTIASQDAANKYNRFDQSRSMHIEDDNIIQKQNASNQMRQAAVIAAVASQQKVRLSASERLAMTAIRPTTTQQSQQPKQSPVMTSHNANHHLQQQVQQAPQNNKPAPLPTLETLLAVQRQLKQHTKQNLTSAVPQQVVNKQQLEPSSLAAPSISSSTPTAEATAAAVSATNSSNQHNKPLPPSPPKSPLPPPLIATKQQVNHVTSIQDTYDKDLPPLPSSISPCTSTDDSQLNSLESHQSSPATSLVSLPPPPPPLSAYLQQYDEVSSSCQQSNNSSSSSPSIASSTEVSSVRNYPSTQVIPVPQQSMVAQQQQQQKVPGLDIPSPYISPPNQYKNQQIPNNYAQKSNSIQPNQQCQQYRLQQQNRFPTITPKPQNLVPGQQCQQAKLTQYSLGRELINNFLKNNGKLSPPPLPLPPPSLVKTNIQAQPQLQEISNQNRTKPTSQAYNFATHQPQINHQHHLFTQQTVNSLASSFQLPPASSLPLTDQTNSGGFDQLDSGNFRFPTPPPPDLLFDDQDESEDNDEDEEEEKEKKETGFDEVDFKNDDDDDDDFQCRIPTPPPHKSMSSALFQDLKNVCQNMKQSVPQIFNSSTFSVPITNNLPQPPPLFRQKESIEKLNNNNSSPATNPPSQLTVHINNDGGLLSTADSNHHTSVNHHHHHHHIMMTMTASSSSPSSSSDCDGQSSNSSSSTSGIHSSIDSPSSSNSKLDDFNFNGSKILNKKIISPTDFPTNLNNKNGIKYNSGNINDDHNHHRHHQRQQLQQQLLHHEPSQHHKNISALGPPPPVSSGMMLSNSVSNSNSSIATTTSSSNTPPTTGNSNGITTARRPALKQKKSVSFSDKVELVACAESEDHLPNPLLARVLAGKLQ